MKPERQLLEVLRSTWGYDDFRPTQKDIVEQVYEGRDGLAILSTGGGKSVCFQAPALSYNGTAIVISPLISLMKDQVDALRDRGVRAGMVNSSLSAEEVDGQLQGLRNGSFSIFYVAPERLIMPEFVDILKQAPISFFAIDEAHCISLWGHNFRMSYRNIAPVIREVEEAKGRKLQRVALTATAKPETQRDIVESLEMSDPFQIVGSFDRENIEINVRKSVNKNRDLRDIIETHRGGAMIIYAATVNAVESIHAEMTAQGYRVGKYHGRMNTAEKNRNQDAFLADEVSIMVATNAFGMGVDKPDVRVVVHYQLPGNLEAYFQEIGRAGRDGKKSYSYLIWSEGDRNTQDFFVKCSVPEAYAVQGMHNTLSAYANEGAFNESKLVLASQAPVQIEEFEINSILKVLADEGVILLDQEDEFQSSVGIDVINPGKELDLSYLAIRRKVVVDNLNAMERFARTEMCRRRVLLRYFGQPMDHKNCGNCDVCLGLQINQTKTEKLVAPEVINSALSSVKRFTDKLSLDRIGDFLLGVKITSWARKGYDSYQEFGALKHWTKSNVKTLLNKLVDEGFIGMNPRKGHRVFLTEKGTDALKVSGRVALPESASGTVPESLKPSSSTPGGLGGNSDDVSIHKRFTNEELIQRRMLLHELRNSLADQNDIAPFMVFSEDALKKLAEADVNSTDELASVGLSSNKIAKYGAMIVSALTGGNASKDAGEAMTTAEQSPERSRGMKVPADDDPGLPF